MLNTLSAEAQNRISWQIECGLFVQEQYNSLTNKTVAFFKLVTSKYSPQFIVKADDDVYLRVDRLPHAVKQWTAFESGM